MIGHPHSDFSLKNVQGLNTALVASSWHPEVVELLMQEASTLVENATGKLPEVFRVSGAYEIPQMVKHLASTKKFSAIIPLGCLIRGETAHFDLIASTVFQSLSTIGCETGTAVSNGILTTDTVTQALDRANGKKENKGKDAAYSALKLVEIFEQTKGTIL